MTNLTQVIEDNFRNYAGAVLQSRALVDVRDFLKPSARQIFYCMYTDKLTAEKPAQKTLKAIGSAMRMYVHGDTSALGIIMRAGQPFAFRYPLVDIEGSYGNLMESGNYASPRYTSARLSKFAGNLFKEIEKDTVSEWRENYDDTEKYPMVLPSKGFYNIVNGTLGIGVGAASSIPAFNLKEVNEALIKLLWDPLLDFEEIYCAPDFPTGALLLNEAEVKNSLEYGTGKSCKLRSIIEYDTKERAFIVTEIPYGVYTNTVCRQLEALLDSEEDIGIERFNDLTGEKPLIKIYLKNSANPNRVLRTLLKNTSLQYHYGINMTMLKDGRFPVVFGWKEALQEYLAHQQTVYRKGFEFDLQKIIDRLHIVEGILIAIANIEEVIQIIKQSTTAAEASRNLQKKFLLSEKQAKAILDIRLARLANLEVQKFQREKDSLLKEKTRLETILNSETLLKKEIEKDLREVAQKYGDARRTQILDLEGEEDEPIEERTLTLSLTNQNNILMKEESGFYTQKRNRATRKADLSQNEQLLTTLIVSSSDTILAFSSEGKYYSFKAMSFPAAEKFSLATILRLDPSERIKVLVNLKKENSADYLILATKAGKIKKSELETYRTKRDSLTGIVAMTLDEGDTIVGGIITKDDKISILSSGGYLVTMESEPILSVGRTAKGVKGITLKEGEKIVAFRAIPPDTTHLVTVSRDSYIKKSPVSEYRVTAGGGRGVRAQNLKDLDQLVDFLPIDKDGEIIIYTNLSRNKIDSKEMRSVGRNARGVIGVQLKDGETVQGLA